MVIICEINMSNDISKTISFVLLFNEQIGLFLMNFI